MNKYETIMILDNELSEDKRNGTLKVIKDFIEENGKIEEFEEIGTKKLAYEIKKHSKGYYVRILFKINTNKIDELKKIFRLKEEIIKFIVIKI